MTQSKSQFKRLQAQGAPDPERRRDEPATDFSPAQMQETVSILERVLEGHHEYTDNTGRPTSSQFSTEFIKTLANHLRQAASQAAEIERLTKERASNALEFMEAANQVALEWHEEKTRADRAESRLLALREQVEGLRGHPCPYCNGYGEAKADVLALFDPAQEKP
jgi:hypothetical protein